MKNKSLLKLILFVLFGTQFLVLPYFSLMAQGGKVAVFSLFVIAVGVIMLYQERVWFLPRPLIPLLGLLLAFVLSLLFSKWAVIGSVQLFTFAIGVFFCLLIANLLKDEPNFIFAIYCWCRYLGILIAVLCLYQYYDWIAHGLRSTMLIPYLLPPGNARVSGVFGQSNLTALVLLLSIIAYIQYFQRLSASTPFYRIILSFFGFSLISVSFFLTGSRSGVLALVVVAILFLYLICKNKIKFQKKTILITLLVLLIGYSISCFPFSQTALGGLNNRGSFPIDARFFLWAASILMFFENPISGVGLNHFKIALPRYSIDAHDFLGFIDYETMGYTRWSHNEYLQIMAESGIVGIIFLVLFLCFLIINIKKDIDGLSTDDDRIFLFLLIVPFFVQAFFSWTFRHPALFFLFFYILGAILSTYKSSLFTISPSAKKIVYLILSAGIVLVLVFSFKEYQFLQFRKSISVMGCQQKNLETFVADKYLEYSTLREILPLCLEDKTLFENRSRIQSLLPYFSKIAKIQGTYSQWYNLGVLYRALDDYDSARHALQMAVERQPVFEKGWSALHMLSVEQAVRDTGRPIEDFLPPENIMSDPASMMQRLSPQHFDK